MLERETGRPRGFGFITFADRQGMEGAIREMHGRELGDRVISVNKAQPKMGEDSDHGFRGGGYSSVSRGSYGGGDRSAGQDDCFKCGRSGHWARDCPSAGGDRGGGGGSFSSRSRLGGASGRGDRFGGERERYMDDRYDGGRYGDKNRFDSRENKYGSRDRDVGDRYMRFKTIVKTVTTVTKVMLLGILYGPCYDDGGHLYFFGKNSGYCNCEHQWNKCHLISIIMFMMSLDMNG